MTLSEGPSTNPSPELPESNQNASAGPGKGYMDSQP